jgi:hypothetical protein
LSIKHMPPQDVINEAWLATYNEEMFPVTTQLTQLNCNLYNINKIANFPFTELGEITKDFWLLACAAMFETSVMIVWRLVDPKKNVHSLMNLKNSIGKNFKNDALKAEFEALTQQAGFDTKIADIRKNIEVLRHNRFGHLQMKWIAEQEPLLIDEDNLPISDLEAMAGTLSKFFALLCFGENRSLYLLGYNPTVVRSGSGLYSSDIEKILDLVAKDSRLVNAPEREPELWPYLKQQLEPSVLDLMSRFRRKFGLESE